ncbi:hypothetical protein LV779_02775 [Streptomyces thinghirensis]|nr:hypothetical protein [Streptomyces thinghirensis]
MRLARRRACQRPGGRGTSARAPGRVGRAAPARRSRSHGVAVPRRRAALETLFAEAALSAPFTLCPSTTEPATARGVAHLDVSRP